MSDESKEYIQDTRKPCKYGTKCYQKNPEHHNQYKHPPQLKAKVEKKQVKKRFHPYKKVENTKVAINVKNNEEKDNDDGSEKNNSNELKDESSNVDVDKPSVSDVNEDKEIVKYTIGPDTTFYDKDSEHEVLKECFLVEMPPDFFQFYECLSKDSESVEKLLSSVNLQLIGPYELFLSKLPKLDDKDLYLIHWRFFYDPPEFQAVLKKKGKSELHIGYYRDDPNEKPVFLARNDSSTNYILTPMSDNIFGAVYWFLQNEKKSSPFISMACQKLMDKVKKWAEELSYSIEEYSMKKRLPQIVCRTFHTAGIVVPYNKKNQLGYRKLVESDAKIKKMFQQIKEATNQSEKDKVLSDLQPVITYASIAADECDFGTGLEAGIALFCSGLKELQISALKNLDVAYSLLGREAFRKIIQTHMKYRRKGPDMSVMNN